MFFTKKKIEVAPSSDISTMGLEDFKELLRPILDPDIGASIVDLGLIYDVKHDAGHIHVNMTFTTPACPYGPQLLEEVKYTLSSIDDVVSVDIDVVWDPPWSLDLIDEETRLELGLDI